MTRVPLAAYARLAALLGPTRAGQPPEVLGEQRELLTGEELRTLRIRTGAGEEQQVYLGPSMTGVGLSVLEAERRRLEAMEQALVAARAELEGVIKALRR